MGGQPSGPIAICYFKPQDCRRVPAKGLRERGATPAAAIKSDRPSPRRRAEPCASLARSSTPISVRLGIAHGYREPVPTWPWDDSPARLTLRGRNKVPCGPLYTAFREGELRWRVFQGANAMDRGASSRSALGGEANRHGARLLAPEARPREQPRRNMVTPERSPLWPFVAYCALALVMLAMPERSNDAKGRPGTARANATSGEPSDSEQEIDRSRAAERGRGRQATSPRRIPWRGWKDILWRAYEKMNDNRLLAVAAGVVFYALLALFPAVTAFVSLYGLVADASTIDRHLSLASGILPSGAVDILHEQLTRLTSSRTSALSFGFVSGLLFALWSANSGTKAVIDGLNVAYGETEKRSFIRLNLISLVFTLGAFLSLMLPSALSSSLPSCLCTWDWAA